LNKYQKQIAINIFLYPISARFFEQFFFIIFSLFFHMAGKYFEPLAAASEEPKKGNHLCRFKSHNPQARKPGFLVHGPWCMVHVPGDLQPGQKWQYDT